MPEEPAGRSDFYTLMFLRESQYLYICLFARICGWNPGDNGRS
jgi:hypothetical protein